MSTVPKPPPAKPASDQERYMPGDPIPVPDAVEANTESTWALFSDVPRPPEPDFLDTVPASMQEEQAVNALDTPPASTGN